MSVRTVFLAIVGVGLVLSGCSSISETSQPVAKRGNPKSYVVFGKRYYVQSTNEGYRKEGVASWYGPGFHGKQTSTGETYDMHGLTAAHKSLPIPSYARVTNLDNDKSVVVRINDRGPFVDDRLIDLSLKAAQLLDIESSGTGRVRVEALPPYRHIKGTGRPSMAEAAKKASIEIRPADSVTGNDLYDLQVGAFSSKDNAEQLKSRLAGLVNQQVRVVRGRDDLFRVRIGPMDESALENAETALLDHGLQGHRVEYNG